MVSLTFKVRIISAITQTGTATAKYPSAKFCFPKIAGNAEAIPIEVIIPNPKNKLQTDIIDARKLVVQLSPAIIAYKSPFDQSAPNTIPKNNPIRKVGHLKYNPTNSKTKAIVADDNKIIDAKYKFNRPITDNYVHYYRPRKNIFLDKLFKLGFRLGHLDCGLKIGSETDPNCWPLDKVPKEYFPKEVDGGIEFIA